eukprot:1410104-Prymnesium_polylepis.1
MPNATTRQRGLRARRVRFIRSGHCAARRQPRGRCPLLRARSRQREGRHGHTALLLEASQVVDDALLGGRRRVAAERVEGGRDAAASADVACHTMERTNSERRRHIVCVV